MSQPLIALGLDPGFASFGWSLVALHETHEELLELGVLRTKKSKEKVLLRDDNHRRCGELVRALLQITHGRRPHVICAEAISLGGGGAEARKQISTMTNMGRVWGIVDTLTEIFEVALIQVAPQTIKKACCGVVSASKADVRVALDARFDGALEEALSQIRAAKQHEHPVDATGAIVACLNHDHLRLARAAVARAAS